MQFKKKWRKVFGVTVMMGILLTQLDFLAVLAEGTPEMADEISIERKLDDGTTTQEDGIVSVDENVILEVSDRNETDIAVTVPLGDNFVYDEELTTELNKDREELTIAYENGTNSLEISWGGEETAHHVSLAITATSVSENTIYAKALRDEREYRSESIRITIQGVTESSNDGTLDSDMLNDFSGEESVLDSEAEELAHESISASDVESKESQRNNVDKENLLPAGLTKPDSMGMLNEYEGAIVIDDSVPNIDSKFSFQPRYIKGVTQVIVNGRNVSFNGNSTLLRSDDISTMVDGTFEAKYEGVGFYNGKLIDVIMGISSNGEAISESMLYLNFSGKIMNFSSIPVTLDITYRFVEHETQEPVTLSGFFTFRNVGMNLWFAVPKAELKDVYTVPDTLLSYAIDENYFYALGYAKTVGGTDSDGKGTFQFTYEDASELHLTIGENKITSVFYVSDSMVLIDISAPVVTGDEEESDLTDNVVEYRVAQDLPYRGSNVGYPSQIILTTTYEQVLKDPIDVKITKVDGTNVTSYFDITVSDGEIIAALKDNQANIYGEMLFMTYSSTPKEDADLSAYAIDNGNELYYEFSETATLDDGESVKKGNTAYATIPASKVPQPSVEMYMENLNGSDTYKVGDRILYTISLKNSNENPYSIWTNVEIVNLVPSGLVVDPSTLKSIYKKKDGEVVESYLTPNSEQNSLENIYVFQESIYGTEEFIVTFEAVIGKELANSTVTNTVVVTLNEAEAFTDNMVFEVEGILEFVSAPDSLNFGSDLEISLKEEVYPLDSKDGDLIVQDTRGEGNSWSVTAELITDLTNECDYVLSDSLYYVKDGQEKPFSTEFSTLIYEAVTESSDPVIISRTWGSSEGEVTGPVLKVKPGQVRSGLYHGEICWTLQVVPGNE